MFWSRFFWRCFGKVWWKMYCIVLCWNGFVKYCSNIVLKYCKYVLISCSSPPRLPLRHWWAYPSSLSPWTNAACSRGCWNITSSQLHALTAFCQWWWRCVCGGARVFLGGVSTHAFVLALKAEKEECLPPSCPATRVKKKKKLGEQISFQLTCPHLLWTGCLVRELFDNRRSHPLPPLHPTSATIDSHAY